MSHTLSYFALLLQKDFAAFCYEKLDKINLSQGLLYFVIYIGKHPACSPGGLAKALHFDTGHTARSIDKLVQTGFVLREKNPKDKRAYQLRLSTLGEAAYQDIHGLFNRWDDCILEGMPLSERQTLLHLLEKTIRRKKATNDD